MLNKRFALLLAALLVLSCAAAGAQAGGYTALRDTYAAESGWGEPLLTDAIALEDADTVMLVFFFSEGFTALYGTKADGTGEVIAWAMSYPDQLRNMYYLCTAYESVDLLCGGHFALAWNFGEAAQGTIADAAEATDYAEAILPMLDAAQQNP